MKKYTDGKREIMATEKAYEVIYKEQGFKEVMVEDVKFTESTNTTTTGKRRKSK